MSREHLCSALALILLACGENDPATDESAQTDAAAPAGGAETPDASAEASGGTGGEPGETNETGPDQGPAPDAALPPDAGPPPSLDAPGPHRVGYRQGEMSYTPPGAAEPRTLRLAFWYPTDDETGAPTSYLLGRIARPEVFTDAGLAAGEARPLLVFSHGSGGLAEQSIFFTEFFASHGFVVVAPDHTGNTFRDGAGVPPEMFALRPQDIGAVLDHVYEGLSDDDPLKGRLGEQVVMAGHSFGGYTTLSNCGTAYDVELIAQACAEAPETFFCRAWDEDPDVRATFETGFRDPRIDLGIPMAPLGGEIFDFAAIDVPILLVTAGRDETLPPPDNGDDVWARLDGPGDVHLDFPDAGHFSFANICKELPGVVQGDGCLPDNTDPDEVHRVTNAVSWAFVRKHLFGDAAHDAVLRGDEAVSDAAVVTAKE